MKDRDKVLKQIRAEAQSGLLSGILGTIGELEALKVRLESRISEGEKELGEFRILPQYKDIETEANDLTSKIHDLVNMNVNDRQFLEHYADSLEEEIEASPDAVRKMYEEVGLVLPNMASRRLDDVLE